MLPSRFDSTNGKSEQPLTHTLGSVTIGIHKYNTYVCIFIFGFVTRIQWYHVWEFKIAIYTASEKVGVYILLDLQELCYIKRI